MSDRVIVITGASTGIGAALAEHAAREGDRVVLAARRERELGEVAQRCGAKAVAFVTDATVRAQVEALAAAALAKFGHIDVWVNNAGRGISRSPSQLTDVDLDSMLTANVKSALYGMQAVLPHFKERGKGHLINVSSMLARVPVVPMRSAYTASKAFLNALTSMMRMELAEGFPGIVVSTVSPGIVATDFGNNALHGGVDSRKLPFAQKVEEVAAAIYSGIQTGATEIYTRPGLKQQVTDYYSAEDMAAFEKLQSRR
jgi:short-subunit dehydrogenase